MVKSLKPSNKYSSIYGLYSVKDVRIKVEQRVNLTMNTHYQAVFHKFQSSETS